MGGAISSVEPYSLAERVSLQPGDELLSINGHPLRDVIDVRFYAAEEHLTLRVRRDGREFTVEAERRYDEPLGLAFTHPTFDGIRRCNNRCEFCFVAQMPPGLRRSLYVKDDDYRYSFLFGNYITLTNLDESDWERFGEQHLSPLYVSVHATDGSTAQLNLPRSETSTLSPQPERPVERSGGALAEASDVRRRVLGNAVAPDVMDQLRRLAGLGIEVHTQIVVVPGLNDGPHLDRSIGDLASLYPAVRSVSVVPVGLTRFHRGGCRVHTLDEARSVFEQVTGWQERLRERLGLHLAYLSDEWYLRLGEEVPPAEAYDGLDLTENGVGLVRRFLEAAECRPESGIMNHESRTLVTGTLFAPALRQVTARLAGIEVVPVVNRFFGETVTVAGLLTGRDVVAQLRKRDLGDVVALPGAMFGGPEGQSLDELRPQEVGEALDRPVVVEGNHGWGNTGT